MSRPNYPKLSKISRSHPKLPDTLPIPRLTLSFRLVSLVYIALQMVTLTQQLYSLASAQIH